MHISFRRLGQTEYLNVTAEDRTPSDENPRTFLTATRTFKRLEGLLEAAEQARVNEQGLIDLNIFAQQHLRSNEGTSDNLSMSQEELQRLGFPPLERAMRTYLVSIVPEESTVDRIQIRAKMQYPPPGTLSRVAERSFTREELDETLALIERKASDLFDPRLGRDVPKKARFNAEDAHTLFHGND
jgi:hypothetical protein